MSKLFSDYKKDPNYAVSFLMIFMTWLLALGTLIMWKGAMLFAAEYQPMAMSHQSISILKENEKIREFEKMQKEIDQVDVENRE